VQITGSQYEILPILAGIMNRCVHYYGLLRHSGADIIAERYGFSHFRKKGLHPYIDKDGEFKAKILRVKPEGVLVLADETGKEREYAFKEVKHLVSSRQYL
jgi:BirA family biotin operon repressor/biotin-[acetyl-CoA-carboxylase] ligase